jgi:hypothetical protein
MDTDDLSEEAYRAIIIEAERFNHDLTLRFGLLSYHCNDEKEYVDQSVRLIHEMKKLNLQLTTLTTITSKRAYRTLLSG